MHKLIFQLIFALLIGIIIGYNFLGFRQSEHKPAREELKTKGPDSTSIQINKKLVSISDQKKLESKVDPKDKQLDQNKQIDSAHSNKLQKSEAQNKSNTSPSSNDTKAQKHLRNDLKTAQAWFERGLQLNDDSDQEIICYQKALEQDPDFAPAHYRLGAIYMRQAQFEKAEKQFALFWAKASMAEKKNYNINLYTNEQTLRKRLAELKTKKENTEDLGEPEGIVIPYQENGNHILVKVVFNKQIQARMLLDTGADITVVSKNLAEKGWFPYTKSISLQTISQNEITARVVRANSIQLGSLHRNNLQIAIADIPTLNRNAIDGILGMDV